MAAQAKAKILVVRDIERDDIEFISKTLGCLPISHVDHMRPDKLGYAELVAEASVSALFALALVSMELTMEYCMASARLVECRRQRRPENLVTSRAA